LSILAGQGIPGGLGGTIGPGQVSVTFVISSTTTTETAFILIDATIALNIKVGAQVFVTSITPVDGSGVSLSSDETDREKNFHANEEVAKLPRVKGAPDGGSRLL
jgi:hypothetical protein